MILNKINGKKWIREKEKEKEKELGGAWIQKRNIEKKKRKKRQVERGYRREILRKRKGKRLRWSLDTEEKYWEKEKKKSQVLHTEENRRDILEKRKETELGGAWIQKRNIGKKKGNWTRWSLDTEEKYWEKEKEKELGVAWIQKRNIWKKKKKELGGAWIQKRNIWKKKKKKS